MKNETNFSCFQMLPEERKTWSGKQVIGSLLLLVQKKVFGFFDISITSSSPTFYLGWKSVADT